MSNSTTERSCSAVAVSDRLLDAHSAVYTFYDPDFESRSLGTHCILWQIDAARRAGHEWLYLGYWIAECDKMQYKERFLPQERLIGGDWVRGGNSAGTTVVSTNATLRLYPRPVFLHTDRVRTESREYFA